MKTHMRIILFCILFSFYPFFLFAFHPFVKNFSRDTYKAGTQNWDMAQYNNNVMYFANNNGLLEFDGKNWKCYPIKNTTNVRSVLYDGEKRIYAGAFNEFGYYAYNRDGKLEYSSLVDRLAEGQENFNEIWNIYKGEEYIYFQSDHYIFEYNQGNIREIRVEEKIDASSYLYNILFITNTKDGALMLNGNLFIQLPGADVLKNKKVCSILPFQEDKILFVTSFDGLYLFDGQQILPYRTPVDEFLIQNQVFCATSDEQRIVLGTVQKGVVILEIESGNILYLNTFSGLQNNTILNAFFDNQNNLWLGLDKGIDYVILNVPIYNIFGSNNLYGAGYSSLLKNTTLFLGTNQGLYKTTYPLKSTISTLQLDLVSGMEGQVWFLDEIDHTIFCGNDRGTFIIYPDHIRKIEEVSGTWVLKPLKRFPDKILGCSYQGLFILKKENKEWVFSHFIKGDFKEISSMIEEDAQGKIWISHWQKGIFKIHLNEKADSILTVEFYNENKGFPTNRNNTFYSIDKEIVFSSEYGFYSYDEKQDTLIPNATWNNLFVQPPNSIRLKESPSGDVWCVSGSFLGVAEKTAVNTYQMDSLTYRMLQPKMIVGFEHFNFIDNDHIIVSTEDGFSWIDLKQKSKKENNFSVHIKDIMVYSGEDSLFTSLGTIQEGTGKNTFPHSQRSFRFEWIAPLFEDENSVFYSYKLENFEDKWSPYTITNVKEYTSLPKGEYIFRVKAKNMLTLEIAECEYVFTILPAWYETTLARFIYILSVLGFVLWLISFINKRSERGAREMEKRKELELKEQERKFEAEAIEKKKEITALKNQQLKHELKHKSQELANSTMNLIRKNEILLKVTDDLSHVSEFIKEGKDKKYILEGIREIEKKIKHNIEHDDDWKKFQEHFDLVYENFLERLNETFPDLNINEKKLCAYLKMGLSSKDIASLLNSSVRSVETNRYRLRKKMDLERNVNLSDFLQRF